MESEVSVLLRLFLKAVVVSPGHVHGLSSAFLVIWTARLRTMQQSRTYGTREMKQIRNVLTVQMITEKKKCFDVTMRLMSSYICSSTDWCHSSWNNLRVTLSVCYRMVFLIWAPAQAPTSLPSASTPPMTCPSSTHPPLLPLALCLSTSTPITWTQTPTADIWV